MANDEYNANEIILRSLMKQPNTTNQLFEEIKDDFRGAQKSLTPYVTRLKNKNLIKSIGKKPSVYHITNDGIESLGESEPKTIEEPKEACSSTNDEVNKLKCDNDNLKREVSILNADNINLKGKLSTLETEVTTLKPHKEKLSYDELKSGNIILDENTKLICENSDLKTDNNLKLTEITNLKDENDKLLVDVNSLKKEISENEKLLVVANGKNTEYVNDIATLKQKLSSSEQKITSLKQTIDESECANAFVVEDYHYTLIENRNILLNPTIYDSIPFDLYTMKVDKIISGIKYKCGDYVMIPKGEYSYTHHVMERHTFMGGVFNRDKPYDEHLYVRCRETITDGKEIVRCYLETDGGQEIQIIDIPKDNAYEIVATIDDVTVEDMKETSFIIENPFIIEDYHYTFLQNANKLLCKSLYKKIPFVFCIMTKNANVLGIDYKIGDILLLPENEYSPTSRIMEMCNMGSKWTDADDDPYTDRIALRYKEMTINGEEVVRLFYEINKSKPMTFKLTDIPLKIANDILNGITLKNN